jgi:RHS repeat-associated protein
MSSEYVWDYRNRLSSVTFKDAAGNVVKSIEYTYDSSDRRISKKVDGVVAERYVYDGANIAIVFDGAGTQTHRYLYGDGVDQILADERGGSVVWALTDNLSTVRDLIDGGGVVLNHVVYDSYGRVISQTNPAVEFRYGYTGREQDNETGLDYYRARYYDAGVGRFVSEDPIGFSAGDANLYRYVGNSPVNATDPSGLRDSRWPSNGAVKNLSKAPIYPLISNLNEDRYERLDPGKETPNYSGYSKDVDGVWVLRQITVNGMIKDKWFFFPIKVTAKDIAARIGGNMFPPSLKVYDDRVEDSSGKRVYGWDPDLPEKNLDSCPHNPNNDEQKRGRITSRIPPDLKKIYPDASNYVQPENTLDWKTILMQIIERESYVDPRVERRGLGQPKFRWNQKN